MSKWSLVDPDHVLHQVNHIHHNRAKEIGRMSPSSRTSFSLVIEQFNGIAFTIHSSNQVAKDELQLLIEVHLHLYCQYPLISASTSDMVVYLCDIHKARKFGANGFIDWAQRLIAWLSLWIPPESTQIRNVATIPSCASIEKTCICGPLIGDLFSTVLTRDG